MEMGDTQLLAKLSEGDLIAQEAKYHKKCMTKFSNQYRAFVNTRNTNMKVVQKKYETITIAMLPDIHRRKFTVQQKRRSCTFCQALHY